MAWAKLLGCPLGECVWVNEESGYHIHQKQECIVRYIESA
jgi:hypothetical protein